MSQDGHWSPDSTLLFKMAKEKRKPGCVLSLFLRGCIFVAGRGEKITTVLSCETGTNRVRVSLPDIRIIFLVKSLIRFSCLIGSGL